MILMWQQLRSAQGIINICANFNRNSQLLIIATKRFLATVKYPLIIDTKAHTFYEIFSISENAGLKDIKSSFKKLSKLYHPDIISGKKEFQDLSEEDQQLSKDNYIKLIDAYEILIDPKKRLTYDMQINKNKKSKHFQSTLGGGGGGGASSELKYTSNGLNFSRNRVHYGKQYINVENSRFTGRPTGHSKYGVPHFDYDFHLKKNLRMEQRLMNKKYNDIKDKFGSQAADDVFNSDRRYHTAFQKRQQEEYNRQQREKKTHDHDYE